MLTFGFACFGLYIICVYVCMIVYVYVYVLAYCTTRIIKAFDQDATRQQVT